MQPRHIETLENNEDCYDKPNACKEIKIEKICLGLKCGEPVEELYYVGYNFEGQKIFQYITNTVNVHFETI